MNSKLNESAVIDVNTQLQSEFEERVFARMCQLLEKNSSNIVIDGSIFDTLYPQVEEELLNLPVEENKESGDYMPFFITPDLLSKLKLLRLVERFLNEEETVISDIVGAVINPSLCKGKRIDIKEDATSDSIYIKLISQVEEII